MKIREISSIDAGYISICFFFGYFFQNSCYSKLEKADILELTVQHLKNLKSQQITGRCALSEFINPLSKIYFQWLFLQRNSSGWGSVWINFQYATLQLKVIAHVSLLRSLIETSLTRPKTSASVLTPAPVTCNHCRVWFTV